MKKTKKSFWSSFVAYLCVFTLMLGMAPNVFAAGAIPFETEPFDFDPISGVHVHIDSTANISTVPSADTMEVDTNGNNIITVNTSNDNEGFKALERWDTVTITNTSDTGATIAFNWRRSNKNILVTIDGVLQAQDTKSTPPAHAYETGAIAAGESIELTVGFPTSKGTTKVQLYLSDFVLSPIETTNEVTVEFPEGVAVQANGVAISSGASFDVGGAGLPLSANPDNFVAWVDSDNTIVSTTAAFTYVPVGPATLRPVYGTVGCYKVGTKLYEDFDAAMTAAQSADIKTAALLNNTTLPAGTYTVPAGVTFLIPYDVANTVREIPKDQELGAAGIPGIVPAEQDGIANTLFRELTLASGAEIIVNGQLQVGGRSQRMGKGTNGDYAQITMSADSKITVGNGGILSAWGYVKGSGAVNVKAGGTVYENLAFMDYPGDADTMNTINDAGAFPLHNYAVVNVEVPMTVNTGAFLKGFMCIWGTNIQYNAMTVDIIGNTTDNMLQLSNGTMILSYEGSRQKVVLNGQASINSIVVSATALGVGITIDSAKTGLPIPAKWDMILESGKITVNNSLQFLAGSTLIVNAGAEVVVPENVSITLVGAEQDPSDVTTNPKITVNGTVTVNGGFNVTAGGADVVSTTGGKIIYGAAAANGSIKLKENKAAVAFDTTPVKLTNSNGDLVDTANATVDTAFNYCATHGMWYDAECAGCNHECVWSETYTSENGQHWKTCTVDGCDKTTEKVDCDQNITVSGTPADCLTPGVTDGKKCSVCGAITVAQTETTANGHTFGAVVPAKPATCEAAGNEAYKQCSTCGKFFAGVAGTDSTDAKNSAADFVIGQLAHTYDQQVATDDYKATNATCTAEATYYYSCTCGEKGTETFASGDKLEHSYLTNRTKDPTCTEDGEDTHTCKDCRHSYTTAVAKIGHSYSAEVTKPTCTEQGYTTHTCANCGDNYVDSYVDATNHEWDEVKYTWNGNISCTASRTCKNDPSHVDTETVNSTREEVDKPTCDKDGTFKYTAEFTSEWATSQVKGPFAEPSKLEHDLVQGEAKAATCTEDGWNAYEYCKRDGCTHTTKVTLPKTGHEEATAVEENRNESTCTVAGSYESVVYCSVCNAELSRETKSLELAAHTEGEAVEENRVESTCTVAGSYESVVYCTVCNAELSRETKELELAAHTEGAVVVENEVAATCTAKGSYDNVVYCSVCNTELSRETKALELADCKDEDPKDHACDVCGETVSECTDDNGDNACDICKKSLGVAQIGDKTYATLKAALDDAATMSGDVTITLLADIEGKVEISQVVTINKGEYEFTYAIVGCYKAENSTDGKTVAFVVSHTPGETVQENFRDMTTHYTYDVVVRCAACGEVISSYAPTNVFAGLSMDLGNTLTMKFIVDISKLEGTENYAVIYRTRADGSIEVGEPIPQSGWTRYSSTNANQYQFTYGNLAGKEMTDVLYGQIFNSNDEPVSVIWKDSIRSYAMRAIGSLVGQLNQKYDVKKENQLIMFVDMLNYGAAAQQNFGYNTGDLANSLLTAEHKAYASAEETAENICQKDDAYSPGTSMNLASRLELRMMFKKSALTNVAYAVITHTKHTGVSVEETVLVDDFQKYNNTYVYVPVTTLSAADCDQVVTCVLYDADGNEITRVVDSMSSYLYRAKSGLGQLAVDLLKFTRSAYAYFHP